MTHKQFCNLTEVVVRATDTEPSLVKKVRLATILGTIQSTLTNFQFLSSEWKKNTEEERLLGVSLTGIMDCEITSNPDPKKRLIGTDSLVKAYKKDTPFSESLDESFNIAFAAGIGVTLTAADLGMKAQSGFAYHPSVIEEMDEVEEEVRSADYKGVIVRTASGKTVVRKQKVDRKIIGSGNLTDGQPDDTV